MLQSVKKQEYFANREFHNFRETHLYSYSLTFAHSKFNCCLNVLVPPRLPPEMRFS